MTLSLSTAQQAETWLITNDPYLGDNILSITTQARIDADLVEIAQVTIGYNEPFEAEQQAHARLIAAAPDHALICWAMCVGAGRWEQFGDGKGEFCINGLRHATELDEFGCPRVTSAMRYAILKARGAA